MASVAARTAGWARRLGAKAGPLGPVSAGSGESPSGKPVQVEIFVDGLWTDITSKVMTRDGSYNVSITRGQPDEGARVDPGLCRFQLNNRDGLFSPRNPVSPYFGKIGRNTPLRVSVPRGNDKNYRFHGEISSWPQKWDVTGTDVWVEVEGAGILRRLGQGNTPLKSVLYRSLTTASLTSPPVAYWPCEDMANATSIASGLGGAPMSIVGTPTLHTSDLFAASDSLPTMGSARFVGPVPSYSATGQTQTRFLMAIPSAGVADTSRLCLMQATGTAASWELYYGTGGALGLRALSSVGVVLGDSGAVSFGVNGEPLRLSVELTQSGADVNYVIATLVPGASTGLLFSGTVTGATVGSVTSVFLAPDLNLSSVVMGHLSVQTTISSIFDLASQLAAYDGEASADRMSRLFAENGVTFGASGGGTAMGPQRVGKLMDLIQECVDADLGTFFETRSLFGLGYRNRSQNYNQSPAVTLSYPGFNLAQIPEPLDDDRFTRNDVTVSRVNGSSFPAVLSSGALSVLDPPAGVGRYDTSVTLNVHSDNDLPSQAGWRLHLGTVDEARFPRISVNLAHQSFATNSVLKFQALDVTLGLRVAVTGLPSWLPPGDLSQLVTGMSETIDQFQHRITWNCVPESPYEVATLDDTDTGRLDTAGSSLAADVTAAGTALSVATTSGPTWTTDLSETPFDILVAGERMTVAAVGNLLSSNPFFLTDLTGWTAQNGSIARSTDVINSVHDAVASMLITPDGSSATGGAMNNLTGVGTITPGLSYTVSLWAYSPAGWTDLRPAVDWYDSSSVFLSSGLGSGTSVAAGVWTYITQTLVAPASASQAKMRARHGGTPAATNIWYAWAPRLVDAASVVSTSPQQMTVIRSVNGIVKAQLTGADVRLNQPSVLAL